MGATYNQRTMAEPEIVDNRALNRFELHADGEIAFILYSRAQNSIRLIHTEVPDSLRGKGIGSALVKGVLRLAEQQKLSVVPACPFVAQYLKRHPECATIVDPQHTWMIEGAQ